MTMKTNSPSHQEITQRAREIWEQSGSPDGRDTDIWLEAERQLSLGTEESNASYSGLKTRELPRTTSASKGAVMRSGNNQSEHPTGITVEHHIPPTRPDDAAIKASAQKNQARAPKVPGKNSPKSSPPETGKPLWDRPHSS